MQSIEGDVNNFNFFVDEMNIWCLEFFLIWNKNNC